MKKSSVPVIVLFVLSCVASRFWTTEIAFTPAALSENAIVGTVAGSFSYLSVATFELAGPGADNAYFNIAGNVLKTAAVLDFEDIAHPNGKYSITVAPQKLPSAIKSFTITITNVNEAPTNITLDKSEFPENSAGCNIGTLSGEDPDAGSSLTFTLVNGDGDTDNDAFEVIGNTLNLKPGKQADFETRNTYYVRIQVSDGTLVLAKAFSLLVTNVNEAPTAINLSANHILENCADNTTVGTLSAAGDPDANAGTATYDYTLAADLLDNNAFTINTAHQLILKKGVSYETRPKLTVRMRATDKADAKVYVEQNFDIIVDDVNEAPTAINLSANHIPENSADNTAVGSLSVAGDPDANAGTTPYDYTLAADILENNAFTIDAAQRLVLKKGVNYETKSKLIVRIRATDQGDSTIHIERDLDVIIDNVNEAPTGLALDHASVEEGKPGIAIGTLSTQDPDAGDSWTYALVAGDGDADNGICAITGSTLRLAPGVSADFASKTSLSLHLKTTDAGGLSYEKAFTITVTNVNDAPTDITLTGGTISENTPGAAIGTLGAIDPDTGDRWTYALVAGDGDIGNSLCTITGNALALKAGISVDAEATPTLSVRVRTTDAGGLSKEKALTITVISINEAPTGLTLAGTTVPEITPGVSIGTLTAIDPDAGDTWTYALVAGDGDIGNGLCSINGSTLALAEGVSVDLDAMPTLSVRIRATDAGGLGFEKPFTITVTNVNEAPTGVSLAGATVAENNAGAAIGTLSAIDPDRGNTFTYTLVAGDGDTGNSLCAVTGATLGLKAGTSLDAEATPVLSVRIRATDQGGLSVEKALTITVTSVNEAPTGVSLAGATVTENSAGAAIGTLGAFDPDAGDTWTFTLVAGTGNTHNGLCTITGNSLALAGGVSVDAEATPTLSVRVRVTDAGGLNCEKVLTISVTNVNEAPTGLALAGATVAENAPGAAIGILTAADPDIGDSWTYALVAGEGDTGNSLCAITGNALALAGGVSADHETTPVLSVRIRATDAGGLGFEKTFTIAVTNVNEAPTGASLDKTQFPENIPGAIVGTLTGLDPDAGASCTFALTTGVGDADNGWFEINGSTLKMQAGKQADFETKSSYAVRIRVKDQGDLVCEQAFTLSVTDVNDAPTGLTLTQASFPENSPEAVVGTLSGLDPDAGNSFTFALAAGAGDADNGWFEIRGSTLKLRAGKQTDFETKSGYAVRVQVKDQGDLMCEQAFTLSVTDVNEAPTSISIDRTSFPENAPGTQVGLLCTVDPDAGSTCSYALVAGEGDADNDAFQLVDGGLSLKAGVAADCEAKPRYQVRLRSTDQGGLWIDQALELRVTNVNEAPTALTVIAGGIKEKLTGASAGDITVAANDPDAGDTFSLAIIGGADQDLVQASGMALRLKNGVLVSFATKPSLAVLVRVTDAGGLAYEQALTLPVIDRDDLPVFGGWNDGTIYYSYTDSRSVLPADFIGGQGIFLIDDAVRPGNGGDYGGIRMVVSITDANAALGDELACESYGSAVVRTSDGSLLLGGVKVGQLVGGSGGATSIALDLLPACSPEHLVLLCRSFQFRTDGAAAANRTGRNLHLAINLSRAAPTDTIPSTSTLTVRINTSNRPPQVALTPVQLGRGESRPLLGLLKATDDNSPAEAIIYRVLMPPSRGTLRLLAAGAGAAIPLAIDGVFTQADVDRPGALVYEHGNGTDIADALLFRLEDGDGLPSDPLVLSFTISQDNFAPVVAGPATATVVAVPGQTLSGRVVFNDDNGTIDALGQRVPGPTGDLDFVTTATAPPGVDFTIDAAHIAYLQVNLGGSATVPWQASFPEAFVGQLVELRLTCRDRFGANVTTVIPVQVIAAAASELHPRTSPPLSFAAANAGDAGFEALPLVFAGPTAFAGQTPVVTLLGDAPTGTTATCGQLTADGSGSAACTVLLSMPRTALQPGLLRFTAALSVRSGDATARASGWQPLLIRIPPSASHASN